MLNSQELNAVGMVVDRIMTDYAGRDRKKMEKKAVIAATFAAIWSQDSFGIVIPKVVEQNARLELEIFPRK